MNEKINNKYESDYNRLKKEYSKVLHDETLKKYRILSRAYKLGIKIYGKNYFSVRRLSEDFDVPYTTAKRVLALERANKNTWELIRKGKLSSFKAAQICLTKNYTFQDEIVKAVINDNLSTYQIEKYRKVKDLNHFKKVRLSIAMEKGFARKSTAFTSFVHYINQMHKMLELSIDNIPEEKIDDLSRRLIELKSQIDNYLNNLPGRNYAIVKNEKNR